jgi:hypothetical protein
MPPVFSKPVASPFDNASRSFQKRTLAQKLQSEDNIDPLTVKRCRLQKSGIEPSGSNQVATGPASGATESQPHSHSTTATLHSAPKSRQASLKVIDEDDVPQVF